MITAIIGHRGSGKTQFLRRARAELAKSGQTAAFIDIDSEIERGAGRTIVDLFPEIGEEEFRRKERAMAAAWFDRLRRGEQAGYVGLGAGFDGEIPSDVHVLWIQRPTDGQGRIFLDRPALDPDLGPLDDYHQRYSVRSRRFRQLFHETLVVVEGCPDSSEADRLILGLEAADVGGCLTVLPENLGARTWGSFLDKRLRWSIDLFEIRDDLLDESMRARAGDIPAEKRLLSYRLNRSSGLDRLIATGSTCDWALELDGRPVRGASIVSLHRRRGDETVAAAARRLTAAAPADTHLKLAVMARDFGELWQGHRWWLEDTSRRSFLPRSAEGRWAWYRQIQRGRMRLNFVREGLGSAPDQPTLSDWVSTPPGASGFAAILGDPVDHSRTPAEQAGFFANYEMPVVRIRMTTGECNEENLRILARLGLTHAAVTSPLKEAMYGLCAEIVGAAAELNSVNTVIRHGNRWIGTNTDVAGLEAVAHGIPDGAIGIWGGGGTRSALLRAMPDAVPFSARTGRPLDSRPTPSGGPETLVWAVGRNRQPDCVWPPEHWRPGRVLDLNYSEDSPGREYAWLHGLDYVSGLEIFRVQAERQRQFWTDHARQ